MSGHWRDQAACAGADTEQFFVQYHDPYAKRICGGCPVADQCLKEALENPWIDGIWGGTTTKERDAMRRRHQHQDRGAA
jgi:WhiB family transcriptional regulator, redox-sensing transcriptional regulator